jgi:hypothetical protein
LSYRRRVTTQFEGLYGEEDEEDTEETNGGNDKKDEGDGKRPRNIDESKAKSREKSLRKWRWELVIYSLTNGDITKNDQIYKLNHIQVLNFISMKKELGLGEYQQKKQGFTNQY